MDVIKTYIPKRYRSKKLVNSSGSSGSTTVINSGSELSASAFVDSDTFYSMFEYDAINDAIKAKKEFYSTAGITAYGTGTVGGGGGTGSTVTWGTESAGAVPLTVESVTKTLSLASHTHSGYLTAETDPNVPDHVKAITTNDITNWNSYGSQVHSHLNRALLDTYTQVESDLADAVAKKHTHSNKTVLDATTASFTTADESKLDGLSNYTHPTNHDPSIITQDPYNRFFTDIERTKLSGIAAGAEVNVNADWNATTGDAQILNKPTTLSGYGITDALGINSNAVSASKLQTARTIWGVSFDGTNNVAGHLDLITSDLTWGGFANGKTTIKGTTDGLIVYPTGINGTGNIFVNSNGVYHAGNSNRSDVNWTANTLIAATDITLNALASTDKSVKNFINKFNSMFDTDTNGNIIAKTNLYSVGGISAYQSGAGIGGLKLMGDMDANGKRIDGISSMSGQGLEFSGVYLGFDPEQQRSALEQGIFSTYTGLTIASWDSVTNKYYYGGGSVNSTPEGLVTAYTGFKFGNYTFKQDGSERLGIYNGATEIACFNTDGTYVNL